MNQHDELLDASEFIALRSKTKMAEALADNKEQALHVCAQNPYALAFVSDRMKDDIDVVKTAVNELADVVKFAGPVARDNKEIGLSAVMQDGNSFKYLSERLRNDPEVAVIASYDLGDEIKEHLGENLKASIGKAPAAHSLQAWEAANKQSLSNEFKAVLKPKAMKI
ncbi:hypothetical protein AWB71_02558 [Caballeronia peredens]|nr:hypothetical protein AWB71_02558 [Caballeronia peredens]